jgi:2-iminobutanoate/2-iminopropanoate deaminase
MKTEVSTDAAPGALGPYSQAILDDGLVFCSGQVGLDPQTKALAPGGIEGQTERALKNLGAVLDAAGSSYAGVLKTTCFLASMDDFAAFNAVYERFFPTPAPARSTFAVAALPINALVEIEAIARRS